jgi:hypothetical protein
MIHSTAPGSPSASTPAAITTDATTTRRQWLSAIAAPLTLTVASPALISETDSGTPAISPAADLVPVQDPPLGHHPRIKILDPTDERAILLASMYSEMIASSNIRFDDETEYAIAHKKVRTKEYQETSGMLWSERVARNSNCANAVRNHYSDLIYAVVEVFGGKQEPAREFCQMGTTVCSVLVGRRLYTVSHYDAQEFHSRIVEVVDILEWEEYMDLALSVVDL